MISQFGIYLIYFIYYIEYLEIINYCDETFKSLVSTISNRIKSFIVAVRKRIMPERKNAKTKYNLTLLPKITIFFRQKFTQVDFTSRKIAHPSVTYRNMQIQS